MPRTASESGKNTGIMPEQVRSQRANVQTVVAPRTDFEFQRAHGGSADAYPTASHSSRLNPREASTQGPSLLPSSVQSLCPSTHTNRQPSRVRGIVPPQVQAT